MFTNTGNLFIVVSVVAIFTACSNFSELTDKNYELNIMNGTDVSPSTFDPKYLSTVAISTFSLASKGHSFCTGTLITPNIVITAAHCLVGPTNSGINYTQDLVVYFGNSVATAKSVKVKSQGVHKYFNYGQMINNMAQTPPNDLAMLLLSKNVPEPFKPAKINNNEHIFKGALTWLVGYGQTYVPSNGTTNIDMTGILRKVELPISDYCYRSKRFFFQSVNSNTPKAKGACRGDSGGPMYTQTSSLRGVTSSGPMNSEGYCTGQTFYTDLAYYQSWIQKSINAMLMADYYDKLTIILP